METFMDNPADRMTGADQEPAGPGLVQAARERRMMLQCCADCGTLQYPPREACRNCLSDRLVWQDQPRGGRLVAQTAIRRPYEPRFASDVPVRVGLVALDAGPVVVSFLDEGCEPDARVSVRVDLDEDGHGVFRSVPD